MNSMHRAEIFAVYLDLSNFPRKILRELSIISIKRMIPVSVIDFFFDKKLSTLR